MEVKLITLSPSLHLLFAAQCVYVYMFDKHLTDERESDRERVRRIFPKCNFTIITLV